MDAIHTVIDLMKELNPYEKIDETSELIESGILNSLAILQLTVLLEDAFEISIDDEAITGENFATASAIAGLVMKLKTSE